jgi:hypothetical protein
MDEKTVSIEELRDAEKTALARCCQNDWEIPFVVRYLRLKAKLERAESELASSSTPAAAQ